MGAPRPGQQRRSGTGSPSSGFRATVERRSYPLLTRLVGGPRWVLPLFMGALVVVGLIGPPAVGMAALALTMLIVLWLTYLSWPAVTTNGRLFRGVLVGVLLGGVLLRGAELL